MYTEAKELKFFSILYNITEERPLIAILCLDLLVNFHRLSLFSQFRYEKLNLITRQPSCPRFPLEDMRKKISCVSVQLRVTVNFVLSILPT